MAYTPVLSAALSTQSSDLDMPQSEILRPPWTSRLSSRLSRRLLDPEPYTSLFDLLLCTEVARTIAYTPVLSAALSTQSSDLDMPQSEILRPPWTSRLSSRLSRRL